MEYNLIINQAALRNWIKSGAVTVKHALIIGFIRGLNADDPEVKRYMFNGYYLISRAWMLGEMPLLKIKEDTLSKQLKYLSKLGLIDLISAVDSHHRYRMYARLSKLYFQEEAKRRKEVGEGQKKGRSAKISDGEKADGEISDGEKAVRLLQQNPSDENTPDHIKNDHKEADGTAPLDGAVADSQEQEVSAEAEFKAAIAKLPAEMRRIRQVRRMELKQADLPGLGPPADSDTKPAPSEPKGPDP